MQALSEPLLSSGQAPAPAAPTRTSRAQRKLLIGAALCTAFMLTEIIGGIWCHSLAIITDAAHMLSDVAGFLVGVIALVLTTRDANERYSFGFHRAEVLGALASISIVWVMTIILVFEAIQRLIFPEVVDGKTMFIIALIGVGMNFVLMSVLGHNHGHGHGGHDHGHGGHDHGHGHGHGYAAPQTKHADEEAGHSGCCDHGHDHEDDHSHGHGHRHDDHEDDHDHGHGHGAPEEHGQGAPEEHGHGHGHDDHHDDHHDHGHGHGAPEEHGHGHGHGHDDHDDDHHDHGHGHGAPEEHGHGHGHGHDDHEDDHHDHGHGHGAPEEHGHGGGKKSENDMLVMRAAIAHVIGDILQSIGVAVAGALIWAFSDRWLDPNGISYWYRIDPVCTFLFSILVMWSSVGMTRDAIHVLMAGAPSDVNMAKVEAQLRSIPAVVDVHCLHSWTIAGDKHNMMAHIQISPGSESTPVLYAAQRIASAAGCHHTCFQVEDAGTYDKSTEQCC